MRVSIFFPLRAGSVRAIRKNTRPFLNTGESLFQHKIKQLGKVLNLTSSVKEIVISTNDAEVIEQIKPHLSEVIKLSIRPDHLCSSSTKVRDLINFVPSVVTEEHIFWVHATSPFVDENDYVKALASYEGCISSGSNDSIMSVNEIKQFIWDDGKKKVINVDRDINPWPNTQDLVPLYEINHAFYISSKENYISLNDRIGLNPELYICEGLKKIDIDWEADFNMAKLIADKIHA